MQTVLIVPFLTLPLLGVALGSENPSAPKTAAPKVLFFSKAASWEQKIVHRDGDQLSYLEKVVERLGRENGIDFTFSKDGTMITAENLARFDAIMFFTSGDLCFQARNGRGDNHPLLTLERKQALLDAVGNGKGFIGCNTANYTFPDQWSPGEKKDEATAWRYARMLGAGYMGHNEVQKGYFSYLDRTFPGMESVPTDYCPVDQWYAFNRLMPDMHVIIALDSPKLTGNLYERPAYPIAWARMEGKGRVFYTTMGHTAEIWQDPVFLNMLLGGIRWATGRADADIRPNMATVTPQATEIPPRASKYIASNPPLPNPQFPNFNVHFPQLKAKRNPAAPAGAAKRVLFFSKSAGYEHSVAYREGANVSFLEREMLEFGKEHNIDFVFSKEGTIVSTEDLEKFDAFLFYTSGDLADQPRNGLGDNYPLLTQQGKEALLHAVRNGKGFLGIHCAIETFSEKTNPRGNADAARVDPYTSMLGATCIARGKLQEMTLIAADKSFPGMSRLPDDLVLRDEAYSFKPFGDDLHVVLRRGHARSRRESNDTAAEAVAWARMEGKGRVYYTSLGHGKETWKNQAFRQMLLGALQWVTGVVDADWKPRSGKIATDKPSTKPPPKSETRGTAKPIAEYPLPVAAEPLKVIAIDIGRQLFVDDFLIAETNLTRTYHAAELYQDSPLLKPETPLELNASRGKDAIPVAAPFCDGAWFDPSDRLFKMWYHAGWFDGVGYVTSHDGLHWQRPELDVAPGTNRVLPVRHVDGHRLARDAASVWLDHVAADPAQRWKMFIYSRQEGNKAAGADRGELLTSADGMHWKAVGPVGYQVGDNSSIFYDPFRRQWVFSIRNRAVALRDPGGSVRARFYEARSQFADLAQRKENQRTPLWLKLDSRDRPDPKLGYEPELYHFTANAYESLMVGLFGIFYGPPNEVCFKEKRPKIIDLQVGFSRDGYVYDRPHREAFLKCSRTPGTWNRGYLHPATGVCLVVGDKLYFYFGAWSGIGADREHMYAGGNTGLAILRRDGFASLDAADKASTLTTVPVHFSRSFPFVNAAAPHGELRAEVLDANGKAIPPFSLENCVPVKVDSTRQRLTWKGAADLTSLSGKVVRFRFRMMGAQLYSFWVSSDPSGASNGYVAAGGPSFPGPRDVPAAEPSQ